MPNAASTNRFMRLWMAALASLALFLPMTAHAQQKQWMAANWRLTIDGLNDAEVHIVAPGDLLERVRSRTLRDVEFDIAAGPASDAIEAAHRTHKPITVTLRIDQTTPAAPAFTLRDCFPTTFDPAGAAEGTGFSRVKLRVRRVEEQGGSLLSASEGTSPEAHVTKVDALVVKQAVVKDAPAAGVQSNPAGTRVGAQIAVADLLPVNGLQIASKMIPWGQTAIVPTSEASSKQSGRCAYRYGYPTANQGNAGSGPATNLILLNAPSGAELAQDALPALAVGAQHTSSGMLWLKPGTWMLYVHVDGKQDVAEGDEQNNLRRVRVRVDGSCD